MHRLNIQGGNTACHNVRTIQNRPAMSRQHLAVGLIPVDWNNQWKLDATQV